MIEKLRNPIYSATMRQIALFAAVMCLLLVITAVAQFIGGQPYGLTLATAIAFGAGYWMHRALVKRGWL